MKIVTALFLLSLTACNHVYYAPNTPNVTQFTEKDEVRINGGLISGFKSNSGGGDLQLGYATGKNFGIMLNGFSISKTEVTANDRTESGTGSYGEFGVGYFTTFDDAKEWTFEIFSGAGTGRVKSNYGANENSRVSVSKFFLQPAIGCKWDYIEIAMVARIARVNWKVKQLATTRSGVESDMEYIRRRPDFFSYEPGVILRAGSKRMKGQLGLTFAPVREEDSFYQVPRETVIGYLGLSVNLRAKKNRK